MRSVQWRTDCDDREMKFISPGMVTLGVARRLDDDGLQAPLGTCTHPAFLTCIPDMLLSDSFDCIPNVYAHVYASVLFLMAHAGCASTH